MLKYIIYASIIASCLTFVTFGVDKRRATKGKPRISEANLLWMSWATGIFGGWLAMWAFSHKTSKTSFKIKMVLATILNLMWALLWLALYPEA